MERRGERSMPPLHPSLSILTRIRLLPSMTPLVVARCRIIDHASVAPLLSTLVQLERHSGTLPQGEVHRPSEHADGLKWLACLPLECFHRRYNLGWDAGVGTNRLLSLVSRPQSLFLSSLAATILAGAMTFHLYSLSSTT